jgi:hypothetical protein
MKSIMDDIINIFLVLLITISPLFITPKQMNGIIIIYDILSIFVFNDISDYYKNGTHYFDDLKKLIYYLVWVMIFVTIEITCYKLFEFHLVSIFYCVKIHYFLIRTSLINMIHDDDD